MSQADDDQHDYDSVASDEDTDSEITAQNNTNAQRNNRAKVSSSTHTQFYMNKNYSVWGSSEKVK